MTEAQRWKTKKLIKELESCQGSGTSVISLFVPPGDQISKYTKMLDTEYGTASNIKSRVNRASVQSAIVTSRNVLRSFKEVPPNGLIVYVGEITLPNGKQTKAKYAIEPFKPINKSQYLCHSSFDTSILKDLLVSDEVFGFIVMDGQCTLFATLNGDHKKILQKYSVIIPKKHSKGGQSAQRYGRIRQGERHKYISKVADLAAHHFIDPQTNMVHQIPLKIFRLMSKVLFSLVLLNLSLN